MAKRSTYAATQVYIVAHSLGGPVTRVYAKGKPLMDGPVSSEHLDPNRITCSKCWYHRGNNYYQGDINRMITLSSTHKGSDLSGIISAMKQVRADRDTVINPLMIETKVLMGAVDSETGMDTGAFEDQVPNSPALNNIGPTPIPAHALACVNDDEDLDTLYAARLQKIWGLSPPDVLDKAFTQLGQQQDATDLRRLMVEYDLVRQYGRLVQTALTGTGPLRKPEMLRDYPVLRAPLRLRAATFGNDLNDCTVRMESSHGGLKEPYISVMDHCLHGYAPAYPKVQDRVVDLFRGEGSQYKFCPTGFPPAGGPVTVHTPDAKWVVLYDRSTWPKDNTSSNNNNAGGGNANGNSNANGGGNANGNANGNTSGGANANSNANANGGGNANGNANLTPDGWMNPNANGNGNANGNANGSSNSPTDGRVNPNSNSNANRSQGAPGGGTGEQFARILPVNPPPAGGTAPTITVPPELAADPLIKKALKGVQDEPNNAGKYNFLGAILMGRGETKDAEAAFRHAIQLEPNNPTHRSNLATLFASKEDWPNAEAVLKEAIGQDPQSSEYRLQMGGFFAMQQRWPDAIAAYREAIRLEPDSHQAQHELGRAFVAQNNWPEAIAAYSEAAKLEPDRATYHIDLGVALLGAQKWADAEASFKKAIQLRAVDAPAHAHLATALLRQGRHEEAKRNAQEAMRLGLKTHPVYGELGLTPSRP